MAWTPISLVSPSLPEMGKGDGTDWRLEVYLMRNKIFDCALSAPNEQCVSVCVSVCVCV